MRNAQPPFSPTIYGKRQIFPIPTAEPIAAKTKPIYEPQFSLETLGILFIFIIY
jgi:hypothetical protein